MHDRQNEHKSNTRSNGQLAVLLKEDKTAVNQRYQQVLEDLSKLYE